MYGLFPVLQVWFLNQKKDPLLAIVTSAPTTLFICINYDYYPHHFNHVVNKPVFFNHLC